MVQPGLTFDEYVDLRLKPLAGADRAFHEAAETEREQMFPMNLASASSHLRSRGYDCRPAMLETLIENGVVTPADPAAWTQADVEAAAEHFEECDIFTPTPRCARRSDGASPTSCGRCVRRRSASRPNMHAGYPTTTSTSWCTVYHRGGWRQAAARFGVNLRHVA